MASLREKLMDTLVYPYTNFRFRVSRDGKHVVGVTRISALRRATEVIKHNESAERGVSRKSPGKTEYEAITLERGLTNDRDFENWANHVWRLGAGNEKGPPEIFRKDLRIEIFDDTGRLAVAFKLYRCWVSEYQALPELDAGANAVAIEMIKVELESWEREVGVPESGE